MRATPFGRPETLWHVTVLSNFSRGYDKYAREYSKTRIPESTFPDRFFLLRENELEIGIRKAAALLGKLGRPGDRLIALRASVPVASLHANERTGLGRYIESPSIRIDGLAFIENDAPGGRLLPVSVEEASALSLQLLQPDLYPYAALRPRTFSILPIARGCQASCPFCFSEASASAEQEQAGMDLARIHRFAAAARAQGAGRFVITGGGEPGLVRHEQLRDVIALGHTAIGKTVLITNGHHLARREPAALVQALDDYARAGLEVLAISRHHHDDEASARLMSLRTDVAAIARTWRHGRERWPDLRLRFTCVLQRGAIDTLAAIEAYADWAAALGVPELCFKELYVSTSVESVYHRHAANEWSHANQVPLALVLEFAARHGFQEIARLPWGSPIFRGEWRGHALQIAAYTEPSLLWERMHGIARSWNLMSDGRCLVSLEDRASEITLPVAA
jgi:pyruvate-formate lyase-activating enzyme